MKARLASLRRAYSAVAAAHWSGVLFEFAAHWAGVLICSNSSSSSQAAAAAKQHQSVSSSSEHIDAVVAAFCNSDCLVELLSEAANIHYQYCY
jgi:hypothetical protein